VYELTHRLRLIVNRSGKNSERLRAATHSLTALPVFLQNCDGQIDHFAQHNHGKATRAFGVFPWITRSALIAFVVNIAHCWWECKNGITFLPRASSLEAIDGTFWPHSPQISKAFFRLVHPG